jgi:competence protein ComEA
VYFFIGRNVFIMANRLVTQREFVLLCFIAGAILVGSGVVVWTERQGRVPVEKIPAVADAGEMAVAAEIDVPGGDEEPALRVVEKAAEPVEPSSVEEIVVEVAGAVSRPGIYRFVPGATVADAIEMAGGAADGAEFGELNRAANLLPGTQLSVPYKRSAVRVDGKVVVTMPGKSELLPQYRTDWTGGGGSSGGKVVNINIATASELETLTGVGPKTAAAIIGYRERRPFARVDDIVAVPGIGPKTLETLRPFITVN